MKIIRYRKKIKGIMQENRGETLLELVFSIALFALVMVMMTAMFQAANKVSTKNQETEREIDQALLDIVKEENLENTQEISISFRTEDGRSYVMEAERIETQGLSRFREKN